MQNSWHKKKQRFCADKHIIISSLILRITSVSVSADFPTHPNFQSTGLSSQANRSSITLQSDSVKTCENNWTI